MKRLFTVLLLFICAIPFIDVGAQTNSDSADFYWTSGLRINQGKMYGMIGVTKPIGNRLLVYAGADLGGDNLAAFGQALFRITPPGRLELYAALGPQYEKVLEELTPDQAIEALTVATGAVVTYNPNERWSAWIGATYLHTGADINQWKFGLGFAFPFKL